MITNPRVIGVALVAAAAVAGYWLFSQPDGAPEGFARTNGRIEAERIDIATKYPARVSEVLVSEGDIVEAGQLIARMDSDEIEAQLREAEAGVQQARQSLLESEALLAQRKAELTFAEQELVRSEALAGRGFATGQTVDLRRAQSATAKAAVASAEAGVARANASIAAAQATVDRLRAEVVEFELDAPRGGRVQYRLAEPGEVLGAGGRVVTLLDLTNVYMTIYLPTSAAGRLRFGAEARIVFDAAPQYVIPATVTFVADEAQFTPKYVETESEREKLMFRVKVAIPEEVLIAHQKVVKTGVPGVVYVQVDPSAEWPAELAVRLPDAN